MLMKLVLVTACLIAAAYPANSQTAPDATQNGFPFQLIVGAGFSDFYTDWNGRSDGTTVWADLNVNRGPEFLRGLGLELEGRDLNYGRTGVEPNLRLVTAEGGLIYTIRHYRNLHPYGKFLAGVGRIDFGHLTPTYSHDSRSVIAPGGGVEYRAWRNIWVRSDYEYQFWPDFFSHHALNPNGFTVGADIHN